MHSAYGCTNVNVAMRHTFFNDVHICCVFVHFLLSQLVARGGISVSGIFNYKLTSELSTKACFINRVRVRNCIGIYHQWTNNKIVLDVWYQLKKVKMCRGKRWKKIRFVSTDNYKIDYTQMAQ